MFSEAYKRYVLFALTLVYTWNYLDRGLIILLLEPIKADLHLSDTQLGFLTGIAFGLFYATLGLPIARWADRGNRVSITSMAIALWGVTMMSCLMVTNFVQLVLARIAAAVGDAGCMPPTYSLLGDYFPKAAERTRAMAIYWLASPLALLGSFMVGGRINELYGWRTAFFMIGVPALLVGALIKATVVEPRLRVDRARSADPKPRLISVVLLTLWRQRSSRHLIIALILLYTMGCGLSPWYAAFLMRSHGMSTSELGVWLGLIFGVCGVVGVLAGGYIAGRWFADNEAAQIRLSAAAIASLVPCFALFLLLPRKEQALIALVPLMLVFNVTLGPIFALMQRLVSDDMRATTLAVTMFLSNLIGMGIGPQVVGVLSDSMRPALGDDSLRYAMLMMSFVAVWAAWHLAMVGRTVREDVRRVIPLAEVSQGPAREVLGQGRLASEE